MARKLNRSKRSLKKKYQKGGALSTQWGPNAPGANAFGAAGAAGSSLVDAIDPQNEYGVQSTGGALASGALKGAGMGAALGPVGAIVGGVVGGTASLIGNKKAKEKQEEAETNKRNLDLAKSLQESSTILANYNNSGTGVSTFKRGGNLYSFQQSGQIPVENGDLKPISGEAYEVKGDDANLTDDVGMGDAYVDHNEVLKPDETGIKIFSDTLKPAGSKKTFAKVAKTLEKQKSIDGKNPEQDELIEMKLHSLFEQQQIMNGDNAGESPDEALQPAGEQPGQGMTEGNMFQSGGQMYGGISGSGITDEQEFFNLQNMYKKKKKNYEHGGQMSPLLKAYHKIKPTEAGMNAGKYFGSKVMAFDQGGTIGERVFEFGNFKKELKTEPGHGPGAATFQQGGELITGTNPRDYINQELTKNYPGVDLSLLDQHNKPIIPGRMDTPAQAALRKGYNVAGLPSTQLAPSMTGQALLPPGQKSNLIPTQLSNPLIAETKPQYMHGGKKKMGYQGGGYKLTQEELMAGVNQNDKLLGRQVAGEADLARFAENTQNSSKRPIDWSTVATSAGTLAPTFANMAAARKLPQAPAVHLNKSVNLKAPDFSDQNNALKQGLRAGMLASKQNSAMGQAQSGQAANTTAQYFNAVNRAHGDQNRQKIDVSNRQAAINADIGVRNNALLDQYSQAQTARGANVMGLQSQNRADLANKILGLTAQENQKLSDKQKAKMLEDYLDTIAPGLTGRHPGSTKAYTSASSNKKGGRLLYKKGGKLRMRSY